MLFVFLLCCFLRFCKKITLVQNSSNSTFYKSPNSKISKVRCLLIVTGQIYMRLIHRKDRNRMPLKLIASRVIDVNMADARILAFGNAYETSRIFYFQIYMLAQKSIILRIWDFSFYGWRINGKKVIFLNN